MGRLAAEETAEFETHFVDCVECVGQLKTTKSLIDGLRIVASEQASEPRSYVSGGLSWPFQHTAPRRSLALAASFLLLVALVGTVVVFNQIRRSRVETAQARSASAEWERRYEEEHQSLSSGEIKHQDAERDLKTQLAQLRAELENVHKQNTEAMPDNHRGLREPQINFLTFVLESPRGSRPANGSLNEIIVPRSPANFAMSVALAEERSHRAYSMTIRDDHNQTIWKRGGLKRDRHNSLSVEFNSTFFRSGDYRLIVEGVEGDGKASVVGEYRFHVLKTP